MKIKLLILLYIFFSIISIGNSQFVMQEKNYKLSDFLKPKIHFNFTSPGSIKILANPTRGKFPVSNFITDIFFQGDTIWFGTGNGIMRTTDYFNSFDIYFGTQPFGTDDVAGFYINSNVFAVATAISQEISGDHIPVGTGVKVSTDYGVNWNSFPQPMDGRYDTTLIYGSNTIYCLPVVVPQENLSYDITITKTKNSPGNYTIWTCSKAGGLRKTTNYGVNWQRVLLPPDNLDSIYIGGTGYTFSLNPNPNLNHRVFSILALNDSTLFVGTANGINRSNDWGVSWRKYNFQNSGSGTHRVGGDFVVKFNLQEYGNNKIIWAATRKAEDINEVNSISYSTDFGFTWAYTLKDYAPNNVSSKDSIVYAHTDDGVWRSNFGNFNWSKPGLIYDEVSRDKIYTTYFYVGNHKGDTILIGCGDGLLKTVEYGQPWIGKWKIYRAIQPIDLNSDIKTYSAPNPFSPGYEVTRLFFKSGKTSSKVTIKIFDFGMNLTRTVIQNATRNSPDEMFAIWDGKNDNGFQVANGVYFYRIQIDDDKDVWGKIIVLQ
jgi:hypothetical protein